jgi:hypothetical protein
MVALTWCLSSSDCVLFIYFRSFFVGFWSVKCCVQVRSNPVFSLEEVLKKRNKQLPPEVRRKMLTTHQYALKQSRHLLLITLPVGHGHIQMDVLWRRPAALLQLCDFHKPRCSSPQTRSFPRFQRIWPRKRTLNSSWEILLLTLIVDYSSVTLGTCCWT